MSWQARSILQCFRRRWAGRRRPGARSRRRRRPASFLLRRHCPALCRVTARLPPPAAARLLAALSGSGLGPQAAACGRTHAAARVAASPAAPLLARLTSLALSAAPTGGGRGSGAGGAAQLLLLDPLASLTALTSLSLEGDPEPSSKSWLPPGLRRLSLARPPAPPGACAAPAPAGGAARRGAAAAWVAAVGACGALEELELRRLGADDLGGAGAEALMDALSQVRGGRGIGGARGC